MHSLAITLKRNGYRVSGSDDEVYEPSRSKLSAAGLLPEKMGWYPEKIQSNLSCVILGMHAKKDNPEIERALEIGLPIYSYPTFIARLCKNKHRMVIAGSHGKTTTTAIVMHVLRELNCSFDYLVGANVPGVDSCLRLSNAPLIVIEGDEYPSSALDSYPKLLRYNHHLGLITGISWDHINFYPTFDTYTQTFERFADATPKAGALLYNEEDKLCVSICEKERTDVSNLSYNAPKYEVEDGITYLIEEEKRYPIQIFGAHNMSNIGGALALLGQLSLPRADCIEAICSFSGVEHRLHCLQREESSCVYQDYAHAPSKVAATTEALKAQYPKQRLAAILELHTFSSLDASFINQYENSLQAAELAIVYINPKVLEKRGEHSFTQERLRKAFAHKHLYYITDKDDILSTLQRQHLSVQTYLFMSSGTFGGLSLKKCAEALSKKSLVE